MYKLVKDINGSINEKIILRTTDNANIPTDPANTDFQEYLEWYAKGNRALPADETLPADEVTK